MKSAIKLLFILLLIGCGKDDSNDLGPDTTPPVIELIGAQSVDLMFSEPYVELGAMATDDVDGDLTAQISVSGSVDSYIVGGYTITYTVTDSAGNTATTERIVQIIDDNIPIYLAENGVTIKAKEWASYGDTAEINGITYTILTPAQIYTRIQNGEDVTNVCTSRMPSIENICAGLNDFNQDISSWDTSNVTNMFNAFSGAWSFNADLSHWDVSKVTDMSYAFAGARSFNSPLNDWDVSSVTNMEGMFFQAVLFDRPLNNWDVRRVTNMNGMFALAEVFNREISAWDVSNVTNMSLMFWTAILFNQPITDWDVSTTTEMEGMFKYAVNFNQDLSSWSVEGVVNCNEFSTGTNDWVLPQPNFTSCTP
jgi:surface protein